MNKMVDFPSAKSFADLMEEESTGWPTDTELKRLREIAAADKPTLRDRFDNKYLISEGSKADDMDQFFGGQWDPKRRRRTRTYSNHRLIIMQGVLQATCARALDMYMAETVLGNLRRLHSELPRTVSEIISAWPAIRVDDIVYYLENVPKAPTVQSFTAEDGFPGVGVSEDGEGQIRLHMPMHWLADPLRETLTDLNSARRFQATGVKQPFPVLAAVLDAFVGSWSYTGRFLACLLYTSPSPRDS